jgi:hypothetical protein
LYPEKNTKRKKKDIRGEAEKEPPTIKTPKSSKAPINSNSELPRNKMQQPVMETQSKFIKQIPTEVQIKKNISYRKKNIAQPQRSG